MKRRMIGLLLLAGALLICLALGACGDTGPKGPSWDENILVYAHTIPWANVSQELLDEFKDAHPDIQLEVRDYTDEGGIRRLLTEMLAGDIPDIMEMDLLPYRQMAEKGYLENLWPYIESDPELGRESLMEVPLKAAEVDGKLYTIFRSVSIQTMVGPESLVGDRISWTVEDLLEAFSKMPPDATITDYYATKKMMFDCIFRMNLDSFVNWETGKCSFDSDSFRNSLRFVDNFPTELEWSGKKEELEELSYRRRNGLEMLSSMGIYDLHSLQYYEKVLYGEKISFVGYPVGDDSVGSCFETSIKLAMSSTCRQKDVVWDFLRTTILPKYNFKSMMKVLDERSANINFPVNRADYDTLVRVFTSENGFRIHTSVYDKEPLPQPTEDQIARFEAFYNQIDKLNFCNQEIYDIVWEQCGPYFAGDKTTDETIDLIQNRVSLYVNESR